MDTKVKGIYQVIFDVLKNLHRMLSIAWKMDRKVTFGYYATAMLGAFTPLIASLTMKYLLDYLVANHELSTAVPVIILVILGSRYFLVFLGNLVLWGLNRTYFDYLFRYKIQNEINKRFYEKLAHLDIGHLENPAKQNLISKVRDTMTWRPPDFLRSFSYFFGDLVMYVSAFVVLLQFGWWIPFLITLATLPRLFLRTKLGTIQWSIYGSGAPQVRRIWYLTYLFSTETAIREMRIFRSQNALLDKLKDTQEYLLKLNKKPLDNYLHQLTFPPLIETVVLFGIAFYFLPHVLTGALTIGSYTLLINLIDQVNGSASGAVINFGDMYENNLYVNNYFEILALQKIIKEKKDPKIFKSIKPPKIEFRNVYFKYTKDSPWVLENLSFTINPGESVALVGINGAGKTTAVKLICRFYDVTKGKILINGVDIKDLSLDNWYSFMGTLFQDFVHYYLTVRENIMLGDPDKNDLNLMKEAAKKSGADEFIERLPNKYEQILGREYEDGIELSGGQWQKLAISRAFYQQSPLLILDEPTSAIDAISEYEIFNNLEKIYKGKTLILVSHRFSTVRNASKIIVIDSGKIIEEGTHEELIKLNGNYATMFNRQAEGYL